MANSRNTQVLQQIIEALGDDALGNLEKRFKDELLVIAGNTQQVAGHAKELRLAITQKECAQVLDYIAKEKMVQVTIEQVETAAYALFGNRFIEP